MRLAARVTVEGAAPVLIESRPVDIMKWEMGTKRKITDGLGMADIMRIMHSAAKRQDLTSVGFEDWVASLDDFEMETPAEDPTREDQSGG